MISSNGYTYDSWKILVGNNVSATTKLVNLQHGGGYGIHLFDTSENYEISVADTFISWGWKDNSNRRIIPIASPKLTIIKKHLTKNNEILIIANDYPNYLYRMFSYPIGRSLISYRLSLEIFIESLGEELISNSFLRLYPIDYSNDRNQSIKEKFPQLKTDPGSLSFDDQLAGCKLTVSDTNQTTFLQSLKINKPTIVFWDKRSHEVRDEAKKYLAELYEAGILHDTPESAAEMVRKNFNTIDVWWQLSKTQNARKLFVSKFANHSDNLIHDWKLFLKQFTINV